MRARGSRRRAWLALSVMVGALAVAVLPPTVAAGAEAPLFTIPPAAAGVPSVLDGDPASTERLTRGEAVAVSVDVSQRRFAAAGASGRHAGSAVLARSDDFADALAGSALLADAPLLLTGGARLDGRVAAELTRVLPRGASVTLLGGTRALSTQVAEDVTDLGFRVTRLAGASRVETAVAVATEAHRRSGADDVLVARAYGPDHDPTAAWADAIAAGGLAATLGTPVVVTPTEGLHPAVATFLDRVRPARAVVLGGTAALSSAVAEALPNPVRVWGTDRTATAAALATRAWGATSTGERSFVVVNAATPDGWAFGLVAAGLSADARAPILLVTDRVGEAVAPLVRTCGAPQVDLAVVGDGGQVSASVRERLDALDGDACGPGGALRGDRRLTSLDSCPAVLDYFRELALERVGPYGLEGPVRVLEGEPVPVEGAPADEGAGGDTASEEASGTNVQEAGVDEPDLVETDGSRLIAVARGELQLVDLTGVEPVVASTVALDPGDHQLLLSGTRLLVLSRSYGVLYSEPGVADAPAISWGGPPETMLRLYDVTDVAAPALLSSVELEGDLRSARMVDGVARVVLQTMPGPFDWTYPNDPSPAELERAAEANRALIRASTLADWTAGYVTRDGAGAVTAQGDLAGCDAIDAPPRPSDLGTVTVASFDVTGDLAPTSAAAIAASTDLVYASTDRLVVATQRWAGWTPETGDQGTTELHAFDTSDPGATRYVASGAVPGFLLNPFSLSQHDGYLRVAATEGLPWGPEPTSSSTVTVLQEQGGTLTTVGRVGGLGQGERIQAVRFMGDLAAVVTFRQVDPLYLLDLSTPTAPRVTGEVKIPGYSAYLHRVSDDLLLGVGQDADAEGRVLGTQVATFDISDRAAPRQVGKVTYPDAYSEVEYDHKAFLYWDPARLAVVPIDEWREAGSGFHGAVGLDVGEGGALSERGRTTHPSEGEWPTSIRRAVVVGPHLYTVSESGLRRDLLATMTQLSFTPFG